MRGTKKTLSHLIINLASQIFKLPGPDPGPHAMASLFQIHHHKAFIEKKLIDIESSLIFPQ